MFGIGWCTASHVLVFCPASTFISPSVLALELLGMAISNMVCFSAIFCLCVFIIIFVFAVYNTGYIEIVDKLVEVSMLEAIAEIKTYSRYMADGEVCA